MNPIWTNSIGVMIVLLMLAFIGIWIWAWLPYHRRDFDNLAQLPMQDSGVDQDCGVNPDCGVNKMDESP